jgi:hypothetical protein
VFSAEERKQALLVKPIFTLQIMFLLGENLASRPISAEAPPVGRKPTITLN